MKSRQRNHDRDIGLNIWSDWISLDISRFLFSFSSIVLVKIKKKIDLSNIQESIVLVFGNVEKYFFHVSCWYITNWHDYSFL